MYRGVSGCTRVYGQAPGLLAGAASILDPEPDNRCVRSARSTVPVAHRLSVSSAQWWPDSANRHPFCPGCPAVAARSTNREPRRREIDEPGGLAGARSTKRRRRGREVDEPGQKHGDTDPLRRSRRNPAPVSSTSREPRGPLRRLREERSVRPGSCAAANERSGAAEPRRDGGTAAVAVMTAGLVQPRLISCPT